jgi:hypothetical protein
VTDAPSSSPMHSRNVDAAREWAERSVNVYLAGDARAPRIVVNLASLAAKFEEIERAANAERDAALAAAGRLRSALEKAIVDIEALCDFHTGGTLHPNDFDVRNMRAALSAARDGGGMSRRGDLVFMSSYTDVLPHARMSYSVPKGTLAVFVLIGTMERKEGAAFDVDKAMADLGWVRAPETPAERP